MADVLYSTMPNPVPPNVPSQAYEATSTSEFGQGVQVAGNQGAMLTSVDVLMSNWAKESTYETVGTSTGYMVPLTFNLYNVGAGNTVGSLFDSVTVDATIKWRPETSAACGGNDAWMATDGICYHGLAQVVTINLNNVVVPGQFIYGLAFNTTNYGANPTGVLGPYDSLNFGLAGDGANTVNPTVGSDLVANAAYLNSTWTGAYGDNGAGGTGTFRLDPTGWQGYDPAVTFNGTAVPEPGSVGVFTALAALAGLLLRRAGFSAQS